jgi:hypothetical protein
MPSRQKPKAAETTEDERDARERVAFYFDPL